MKKIISLTLYSFALVLMTTIGCAHYSRGPWAGKVIDAETKQPIEGVAVVAEWNEDYAAGIVPGTSVADIMETQTDKDGFFKIPAKSYFAKYPHGEIYGPFLRIFKPSYKVFEYGEGGFVVDDNKLHDYPEDWKGQFEKPDAVVELMKLKTREERIKNLPGKFSDINEKKIKFYIHLLNIENKDLGFEAYPEP